MKNLLRFELLTLTRGHCLQLASLPIVLLLAFESGAGTFRILHHFTAPAGPTGTLLVSDGVIYGVTQRGGRNNLGTVYRITTAGEEFTILHEFSGADGYEPRAGLVRSGDTLYGTTFYGGAFPAGTVYKLRTDGTGFQTLKSFDGSIGEGELPTGSEPLVLDGNTLYGMTDDTGADSNHVAYGWGTVFRLQTDGSGFVQLKNFPSGPESSPWSGLALDGATLYGTTSGFSGGGNLGTVFRLNTDGSGYKTLWQFTGGADAAFPLSGVVRAGNTLFGTTYYGPGGQFHGSGTVFRINTDGTGFTTLHVFDRSGSWPREGLLLVENVLYGPTLWGPNDAGNGSVYALTTNGVAFRLLKQFDGTNGAGPCGLALSGGLLYGVCGSGGAGSGGVLYTLATPVPSVLTGPPSRTAEIGDDIGFSVVAEGVPPLTYELFFNDTNRVATSAKNTMILYDVQSSQSGTYRIRVSSPFGAVTTSPAQLNVIAPVPRRLVPGLVPTGTSGTLVHLEAAGELTQATGWVPLDTITLTNGQLYFDLTAALDAPRFYRAWHANSAVPPVLLGLQLVPAITLTSTPGKRLRLDYVNQSGPIDNWITLDTVTLTNATQLFFDTSAAGQPVRLYRIAPAL